MSDQKRSIPPAQLMLRLDGHRTRALSKRRFGRSTHSDCSSLRGSGVYSEYVVIFYAAGHVVYPNLTVYSSIPCRAFVHSIQSKKNSIVCIFHLVVPFCQGTRWERGNRGLCRWLRGKHDLGC